ncbi:DUF7119 family protein [Halobacterium zhouii]|uniref:DUF7119 family protein n=1 Tax=Halobacterium zhouii TaxID=2902624 RepID=UPI001E37695C|nr:hypothetical protein [Halobacterium zhouii]
MTDGSSPPSGRESPVGDPVVRGDERVTGERASDAVSFDPDDPERVADAKDTVSAFASGDLGASELDVLRGAAACGALVRATGSYSVAASEAGDHVDVTFVRKWARVHDLPRPIRQHVARGTIPPSAAKHIARVSGDARYELAWAVIDHDLTVRNVRSAASAVNDGQDPDDALADHGVTPGELAVTLPADVHRDLHQHTSTIDRDADDVVADALREYLDTA